MPRKPTPKPPVYPSPNTPKRPTLEPKKGKESTKQSKNLAQTTTRHKHRQPTHLSIPSPPTHRQPRFTVYYQTPRGLRLGRNLHEPTLEQLRSAEKQGMRTIYTVCYHWNGHPRKSDHKTMTSGASTPAAVSDPAAQGSEPAGVGSDPTTKEGLGLVRVFLGVLGGCLWFALDYAVSNYCLGGE